MTITYTMLNKIKDLLNDDWSSPPLPDITAVWEKRVVGIIDDKRDQILITPRQENINYYNLYGDAHLHELTLDLDIRTYQNIDRHADIVSEVLRIIKSNIRGENEYVNLLVIGSQSRNEQMRNMFNHVITISFKVINP